MRNSIRLLWSGIAALLLILTVNGFITFRALDRIHRDNAAIGHNQQVQFETERLLKLLVDAETGQRGYLYTGEERYLEPYDRALREVDAQFDRVAALISDNALQQHRGQQLRALSRTKLQELADTVALARSGHAEQAKALVLSNAGRNVMNEIRESVAEIQGFEARLQSIGIVESEASARSATYAFVIKSVIAVAALLLLGGLLSREMRISDSAARQLLEQKEWFATTLHSIGDAVIATDTSGRIVFLNQIAASLTGHGNREAQGQVLSQVFSIYNEITHQPAEDPVAKVIRTGTIVGLANHTVLRRRDGSDVAIDDSAAPIRNPNGELIGVVLVFRDVTQQRKMDLTLRNVEKLATAGRFAATIAHEINNPLEAAMNSVYLLNGEPGLTSEGRQYLLMAERELTRVAAVARQTLAFYKDTSSPAPVNIPQLLDDILALYRSRIEARGIRVVRNYQDHAMLFSSAGELRQVFANLILNSLDALGPSGVLTLSVRQQSDSLCVEVEDDGIGIPLENLDKIFEPFFTTKKDVGTGLGLWSAKRLVEKHDGHLRAESSNGKTRLIVLLPVAQGLAVSAQAS